MKHLIIAAIAVAVSIGAYAQEIMGPIVPKNTLQLYLDKAKAYTDSKVGGASAASEAATAEQKERIDEIVQKLNSLTARLKVVEATYQQKDGTVGVIAEPGQAVTVNDAAADAYISGQVDQPATLLAKSVSIDNTQISITNMPSTGNGVLITSPTVDVADSQLSGNTQQSSNLVMAQNTETMTVKDTTFTGQTYNTIMTGQRTTEYLKEFTIENCVFDEDCKHVNVWFGGYQDNATLTISNCTVKTCEQFLCIGDYSGADNHLDVVLNNVTIDAYEKGEGDQYSGIIICDDRIATSEEDFITKNPFSKIMIYLNNCKAGGVDLTAENFKMGTGGVDQLLYVYCAKARKTYSYAEYKALFPTVYVNGQLVE